MDLQAGVDEKYFNKEPLMDEILEILSNDARISPQEISKLTGKSVDSVKKSIRKYEKNGEIVK